MSRTLAQITLVVRGYDEAIAFFTSSLGFVLIEDTPLDGKRWVVVAPDTERGARLLLAKAANAEQLAHAGNQTGGRVAFFLETADFEADYRRLSANGVRFAREPREESYGTVAVFLDLYGNAWDLIQPKER